MTLEELVGRLLAVGAQLQLRHGIPPERVVVVLGGPCPPAAGCASCAPLQPAACVYAPLLDDGPGDQVFDPPLPVVEIRAAAGES